MDKCINSVNATLVIPSHPTADYQPKCVTYKTAVTQHMAMPRYEVYLCNACMIVAEAEGEKYIDNQACCRCPAARHRDVSTVHCVMVKKTGKRKDRRNMQQVWCRPWNRSTIVGNNKGVDDHRMLFLQHVNNKNVCC